MALVYVCHIISMVLIDKHSRVSNGHASLLISGNVYRDSRMDKIWWKFLYRATLKCKEHSYLHILNKNKHVNNCFRLSSHFLCG